jgi:hypothetical protein
MRHRDDGTFFMGMGAMMLAIVAFFVGYQVHAAGYRFSDITQVQPEIKTK